MVAGKYFLGWLKACDRDRMIEKVRAAAKGVYTGEINTVEAFNWAGGGGRCYRGSATISGPD